MVVEGRIKEDGICFLISGRFDLQVQALTIMEQVEAARQQCVSVRITTRWGILDGRLNKVKCSESIYFCCFCDDNAVSPVILK